MRRRFMNSSNSVPLSFEALEDGLSISFSNEILYCINGGAWETLLAGENTEEINKGSVISFRHAKSILGNGMLGEFSINKKCNVFGVCSSIVPKVLGEKYMTPQLFCNLFYDCNTIVDASKLELPATTLADDCYLNMFNGCTSLTTAPKLPATTLADGCYSAMFNGCKKLNYIKMLATDISADDCLNNWVSGVASTGTFVKNPEATWDVVGSNGVPRGWTVKFDGEEDEGENDEYFGDLPAESTRFEFPLYLNITTLDYEYEDVYEYLREEDDITNQLWDWFESNATDKGSLGKDMTLDNTCQIYINGVAIEQLYMPSVGTEIYFYDAPSPFAEVLLAEFDGLIGIIYK